MARRRLGPERVLAVALAAALHVAVYRALRPLPVFPASMPTEPPVEVRLLELSAPPARVHASPGVSRSTRRSAHRGVAMKSAIARPVVVSRAVGRGAHTPIEWWQAMHAAVRALEAGPRRPTRVRFGFPSMPDRETQSPAFGWDYAATHRIEALPGGGTIINLTDRCAIVVYGIFFPVCKIGSIPANGELFKHMRKGRGRGRALP